jgi:hypothetical protein
VQRVIKLKALSIVTKEPEIDIKQPESRPEFTYVKQPELEFKTVKQPELKNRSLHSTNSRCLIGVILSVCYIF